MMASLRRLRLVLASQSPQRLQLLRQIGIEPCRVLVSDFPEDLDKNMPPELFVQQTALCKARRVAEQLIKSNESTGSFDVVLGCDTVILLDNEIIGKPIDQSDALKTLTRLNGRMHEVLSGVALVSNDSNKTMCFVDRTRVHFGDHQLHILEEYVALGEFRDRAGSYAIQGVGATLVQSIHGDYSNVVGLPLFQLKKHLTLFLRE